MILVTSWTYAVVKRFYSEEYQDVHAGYIVHEPEVSPLVTYEILPDKTNYMTFKCRTSLHYRKSCTQLNYMYSLTIVHH